MLIVRRARPDEMHTCFAIRYEVFVLGQGVPPELEVDGHDPTCRHVVAMWRDEAVGTGRLRITDAGAAKIERVAVRGGFQGRGIGAAIVGELEDQAIELGHTDVLLNAQFSVVPFYEHLGYSVVGEPFMEACIKHQKMARSLSEPTTES